MRICRLPTVICICIFSAPSNSHAEQDRIPEALARAGRSIQVSAPPGAGWFGEDESIEALLRVTDVIVKGRLGVPRAFLSHDEREVRTEYPIVNPTTLYAAALSKPDLPPATSVTMIGGAVKINGLTYTATYEALPLPEEGTECLLLLRECDKRYYVAGIYYGIFRIEHDRLKVMTKDQKFINRVTAYHDVSAPKAIADIVAQRTKVGQ
jgi:hypothetical protein